MCESSRFRRLSRKCSIFLEFWMRAFFHRPCICLAKFKHNLIRRDIEAVITGLTRNQFVGNHTRVRIPLSAPDAVLDREKKPQSRDTLRFLYSKQTPKGIVMRRKISFLIPLLIIGMFLAGCSGISNNIVIDSSNIMGELSNITETIADNQPNETQTEAVQAHIHTFNPPTCLLPQICSVCEQTEGEALDHSWNAATCTTPMTCAECGATEGDPIEHNWHEATCTEPMTCMECGVTEGEPIEHNWQEATCTTPITCTECGTTEGEPVEHNWQDATCTTPKTCTGCNVTEGTPIEHCWNAATCETPKTCTQCGATDGAKLEHSWKAATCTTPQTCTKCNATAGTKSSHSYVNGTCSVCGTKDPNASNTQMVWIPTNGCKKYHSKSGCSGMLEPKQVTLSEAVNLGFSPCKRCH